MLGEHCTPAGGLDDYYGDPLEWLKSPDKRFSVREDAERGSGHRKSKHDHSHEQASDAQHPRLNRAVTPSVSKGKSRSPPFANSELNEPWSTNGRGSPMPLADVDLEGADIQTLDPTAFRPRRPTPDGGGTSRRSTTSVSAASRRASISILSGASRGPFALTSATTSSKKSERFSFQRTSSISSATSNRSGASDAKLTNALDSLLHDVEHMQVSSSSSGSGAVGKPAPLPPSIARALTLPLAEKRRDSSTWRRRRPMDVSKTSRIFGKDTFMSPPTRPLSSRYSNSASESQSARDTIESASDIAEKTAESLQRVSVKLGAFHQHERSERAKELRTERGARTKMENELRLAAQKHRLADKQREDAEKKMRDRLRRERRASGAQSRATTLKSIQNSARAIGKQYATRRYERTRSQFNANVEKRRASIAHETDDRLAYADKNKKRHDKMRDLQLQTLSELRKAREEEGKERIEELNAEAATKLAKETEQSKHRQEHAEQRSACVVANRVASRRTDASRAKSVRERKQALDKTADDQKRHTFAQSQATREARLRRVESDRSRDSSSVSSKSWSSTSASS